MKSKSTYSLLVSSEEKNRSLVEAAVYLTAIASMAFAVFAFAAQPVTISRIPEAHPGAAKAATNTPAAKPLTVARS